MSKYLYLVKPADGYFFRVSASNPHQGIRHHDDPDCERPAPTFDDTCTPPRWTAAGVVYEQYTEQEFAKPIPGVTRTKPFFCFSDLAKGVQICRFNK